MQLPRPSSARKPVISARGKQLGTATALAVLVVLLVVGTVYLGVYEVQCNGVAAWLHV
jgi:hypothetical protein